MSGAITAAVVGIAGGMALSQMMKQPKMPKPQAPTQAPQLQAAQTPDEAARRSNGGGGATSPGYGPGLASTMLTGSAGIDPAALLLGKNSLLGQ